MPCNRLLHPWQMPAPARMSYCAVLPVGDAVALRNLLRKLSPCSRVLFACSTLSAASTARMTSGLHASNQLRLLRDGGAHLPTSTLPMMWRPPKWKALAARDVAVCELPTAQLLLSPNQSNPKPPAVPHPLLAPLHGRLAGPWQARLGWGGFQGLFRAYHGGLRPRPARTKPALRSSAWAPCSRKKNASPLVRGTRSWSTLCGWTTAGGSCRTCRCGAAAGQGTGAPPQQLLEGHAGRFPPEKASSSVLIKHPCIAQPHARPLLACVCLAGQGCLGCPLCSLLRAAHRPRVLRRSRMGVAAPGRIAPSAEWLLLPSHRAGGHMLSRGLPRLLLPLCGLPILTRGLATPLAFPRGLVASPYQQARPSRRAAGQGRAGCSRGAAPGRHRG